MTNLARELLEYPNDDQGTSTPDNTQETQMNRSDYKRMRWIFAVALAGTGCAGSHTSPEEMSVAKHEQAASGDETEAARDEAQWSSKTNPSDAQKDHIAKHRKEAAEHRAAAQSLRDAEASACGGISEEDRDLSPFYHREDITSVAELQPSGEWDETRQQIASGGRTVFRAVPGLTAEWLQREVDCQIARAAAVGYDMPEMAYCPLTLRGVKAKVSSTGNGFAVDVTSDSPEVGKQIFQRMQEAAKR